MTTKKRIEANRRNALKSTGPKSKTGKAIASQNAVSHGFYSSTVLLQSEDPEQFIRFARKLAHAYGPRDILEPFRSLAILSVRY